MSCKGKHNSLWNAEQRVELTGGKKKKRKKENRRQTALTFKDNGLQGRETLMKYTKQMLDITCCRYLQGYILHSRLCLKSERNEKREYPNGYGYTYEWIKHGLMAHIPSVFLSVCITISSSLHWKLI